MKEHLKVHDSNSEVQDLRNQLNSVKTQAEELEVKLKIASKVAKNEYHCGSCEKTFTSTFNLKRHGKIHET